MLLPKMFLIVIALLLLPIGGIAQTPGQNTIPLTGTVLDANSRPVRSALLQLHSKSTSAIREAQSDATGRFVLEGVEVGEARLTVRLDGKTLSEKDIAVVQGTRLVITLDGARLSAEVATQISPVNEKVTVVGTPDRLATDITTAPNGLPTLSTTVAHEDLERTTVSRDLNEMFNRVPGVVDGTLQQGDIGNGIKVRGFFRSSHGAEVATYIDGMPQNLPAATIGVGFNDMSWLSPLLVEKAEIIKGPSSALYGNQNRAASIDITTRDTAETRASITAGSYGFVDASMVFSHRTGPVHTLISAELMRIGGYRKNSDFIHGTIFAKETFHAKNAVWGFRGYHQRSDWDAPGFLTLSALRAGIVKPTDADPASPPMYGNADRTNFTFTVRPAEGETGTTATAYVERYNRLRALSANATTLNLIRDNRWISGGRAVQTTQFGNRVGLQYGGELRSDYGSGESRQSVGGALTSNYLQAQNVNLFQYAGLVQAQLKLHSTVKITGGLRADAFHYNIQNLKLPASSIVYDKAVVTPKVGLLWAPRANFTTFFNMAQGYRTPEQTEISPPGSTGPLGATGGNPIGNLSPPKMTSYDYGFKTTLGRFSASADGFYIVNEGELLQISAYVFSSGGDATRIGWEAEGRYQFTRSFSGYVSLTDIVKSRLNNPVNAISFLLNVPQYVPKAGVAYSHSLRKGSIAANVDGFYYSGFPYYAGSPLTLSYTKPYSRYDFRGSYFVGKVELTGFAQLQPYKFSSEAMYSTAAGLFIDPAPKWSGGGTARLRF